MLGLYERIKYLVEHSLFGSSADDLEPTLRRSEYGKHVIFYILDGEDILVIRVLREEMDFPRHF